MRKKMLLSLLTVCVLSAALAFGTLTIANANISTNSPTGTTGLMSGGALNATNFIYSNDTDPSAYTEHSGNSTYTGTDANVLIIPMNKIPASVATAGKKITMQFDVLQWGTLWSQILFFAPFATIPDWHGGNVNYSMVRINRNGVHLAGGKFNSLIGTDKTVDANGNTFQAAADGTWPIGLHAGTLAGKEKVTYWIEFNTADRSCTFFAGDTLETRTQYATVKEAYEYIEGVESYYFVIGVGAAGTFEFDNYKLFTEDTVYADFSFDDDKEIISAVDETKTNALMVTGTKKTYDSLITVNAPGEDTAITTTTKLKVTDDLATTFEMNVEYNFTVLDENRKVGVAFGLDSYRTRLSAPTDGASFVYFTKNSEGKIVTGVDNIDEAGVHTAIGETQALTETFGDRISLNVKGLSDEKIAVSVNGSEPVEYDGLKLNGHISLAHTGAADANVNYSVYSDSFDVIAYSFNENEGTEVITADFDGDYISTDKFTFQSTVAPDAYYTVTEGTDHDVEGLVADDGIVGFYGTSTNSRLMVNGQYGDYVLQFDYISSPYTGRIQPSGLQNGVNPNRHSPLFILFGATSQIPELQECYAMGIVDGNATQYFWGAESLITRDGKLIQYAGTSVLSGMAQIGEDETYDAPIPYYTAPNGEVKQGKPANEANSLYNKITRMKLVVLNNNVALYGATVTDGVAGEYRQLFKCTVPDAYGYVGFGTDAPGWYRIDNIAFTPIDKAVAIEKGMDPEITVDMVGDVAVADMETDYEPVPLAKTTLTVTGNKAVWTEVEGASEYNVTAYNVINDNVLLIDERVTALEYDLSALTDAGAYKIKVVAIPAEGDKAHVNSPAATADYTVKAADDSASSADTGNSTSEKKSGCFSGITASGTFMLLAVAGAMFFVKKKENR